MSTALLLIMLSLATARLTRLVVKDDFPPLLWVRNKIIDSRPDHVVTTRDGGEPYYDHWWLGALVSCAWCASGWLSLALVVTVWALHGLVLPLLWWLAVWAAGSWLAAELG
jgi:hypothetical protein